MAIAIRLEPELENRLEKLAKATHRSKSFFVKEAIESYIEELEDYYMGLAVLKNPGQLYTMDEVRKLCGLDD